MLGGLRQMLVNTEHLLPDTGEVVLNQLMVEGNGRLVMVLRAADEGLLPGMPERVAANLQPLPATAERSSPYGEYLQPVAKFGPLASSWLGGQGDKVELFE